MSESSTGGTPRCLWHLTEKVQRRAMGMAPSGSVTPVVFWACPACDAANAKNLAYATAPFARIAELTAALDLLRAEANGMVAVIAELARDNAGYRETLDDANAEMLRTSEVLGEGPYSSISEHAAALVAENAQLTARIAELEARLDILADAEHELSKAVAAAPSQPGIAQLLAALRPGDLDVVQHLETCTHMHVTSTERDQVEAWHARRDKARIALLRRLGASSPQQEARES